MKFKVGDWVKIVNPKWIVNEINMEMKNKIVKILYIRDNCIYRFKYKGLYRLVYKNEIEIYKPPILKKFIEEMEKKECK